MNIAYLRLDHGEWTQGAYNSQEIGLAKAFAKKGHQVTIFYNIHPGDKNIAKRVEICKGVSKTYLPAKNIGHHALLNPKILDEYDIDLLHIQGDNLLAVAAVVVYAKIRKIPYYCYIGRIDSEKSGCVHRILSWLMVQPTLMAYRFSKVYAKTPAVKKQLEKKGVKNAIVAAVGLDKSIIPILNGTKSDDRTEKNIPLNKKVIVCVSRLVSGKQPYDIFQLADILDNSFYYIFIGTKNKEDEDNFRKSIIEHGLQGQFMYIPKIDNTEIHKYYKIADAVVNFNQNEIFGMAILEAMYQGATVVARSAPGPDFIIEDGKSGYLVESVEEMADVLQSIRDLGANAHERIINEFCWEHTASLFLENINKK